MPPHPLPLLTRLRQVLRPRSRAEALWSRARKARFGLRPLHNLVHDLRFGGWCGGRFENPFARQGAHHIQSVDYAVLDHLHRENQIPIHADDLLVDVGCGRGRVLNWWLARGCSNRLVGLELVPELAHATARRLARFPNVEIVPGDAIENLPPDGTLFFLYNPFDGTAVRRFRDRLLERIRAPRRLRVLYFNSRFLDPFRTDPRWRVQMLRTGEPEPAALITPA
jgi:methyltransferase family protein